MKKFNSLKLGLTAGGIFLGAGYVSGQELWKFFAAFGTIGIPGRVISLAVQLIFTYISDRSRRFRLFPSGLR